MIIGQILDVSYSRGNFGGNGGTGAMLTFNVLNDAVEWARLTSERMTFADVGSLYAATVVTNTETGVNRWWFDGTEYTG